MGRVGGGGLMFKREVIPEFPARDNNPARLP